MQEAARDGLWHLTKLCTQTCAYAETAHSTHCCHQINSFWIPQIWPVIAGCQLVGGHLAADTWNDWESAACSHYLVPCIVIIAPALSAPLLPSLPAIVIVIDWCGGQNSSVWKGIRHTSHNRPAIWSPPPPSHRLLLHPSILPFIFFRSKGRGSWAIRECACRWAQIWHGRGALYSVIEYNYSLCWTHTWIDNYMNSAVLRVLEMWHDGYTQTYSQP